MADAQHLCKNGKIICSGFHTGVDKYCMITSRQSAVGKWIFKKQREAFMKESDGHLNQIRKGVSVGTLGKQS